MLGKLWMSLQNSFSASECKATYANRSFTPLLARRDPQFLGFPRRRRRRRQFVFLSGK